jgi:Flp pilus assembly protein CpaB
MPVLGPPNGLPTSSRASRAHRTIRRLLLARRRPLAALCAAAAVLAGLQAVRPPAPATVSVPVASRDLVAGAVLDPGDVVRRELPAGDVPDGVVPDPVGRTLAAPLRRGEAVTDVRLVGPGLSRGYPGRVALPVRIADADAVELLRAGDHVDLIAADPRHGTATAVAVDVPVLAIPEAGSGTDGTASSAAGLTGRLVVLGALPEDVDPIAGAAVTDLLSVVISR